MRYFVGLLQTFCGLAYAVLWLVLLSPMLFVGYLIGLRDRNMEDMFSLRLVQWGFRCIIRICCVTSTVIGHENVPTDQPVLYVANHNSYFDIFLTYNLCNSQTGYIAKSSLAKVPILNMWMRRRMYCLFIDRDDPRQSIKTLQQATDYINQGISMTIFPEGTRGDSEEMIPFKSASFRVAEKSGCPVIPIAIYGTRHIIGDHYPCTTPTHVILQYGDPIYTSELTREEKKALSATAQSRIQEMLDQIRDSQTSG